MAGHLYSNLYIFHVHGVPKSTLSEDFSLVSRLVPKKEPFSPFSWTRMMYKLEYNWSFKSIELNHY